MRSPLEGIRKAWRPKWIWTYVLLAAIGLFLIFTREAPPERGEEKPSAGILNQVQERYLSLRARQWSAHLTESPNTPEDLRERLKREPAFRERFGQCIAIAEWSYLYRVFPADIGMLKELQAQATTQLDLDIRKLYEKTINATGVDIPPLLCETSTAMPSDLVINQTVFAEWMGDWITYLCNSPDVPVDLRVMLEGDPKARDRFALCGSVVASACAYAITFKDSATIEETEAMAARAAKDPTLSLERLVRITDKAMSDLPEEWTFAHHAALARALMRSSWN